jgi:two-component system sensor kinase FixL
VKSQEDFITHAPWQMSPQRQPDGSDSIKKAREMIETAMQEGSHLFEWTHKRIDGEEFPASVLLTRMEIAGKRFIQATVRDVSALKRSETETHLLRNELSHLSRVVSLGELVASLAHEINQPLTAILSNAKAALSFLVSANPNIEEVQGALNDIVNDDQRAATIIHDLRVFLKKEKPSLQSLNISDLVEDVLTLLRNDFYSKGIAISKDVPDNLLQVSGNRIQLTQVIVNLFMNSCDAMHNIPVNERILSIRAFNEVDRRLSVEVVDRGTGLSPTSVQKLFEPFYTTKENGLGMGLAISKTIIRTHGGILTGRNNSDKGAAFCFTLPAE